MAQHTALPRIDALYWRSPNDAPDGVVIDALEEIGCHVSVVNTIGDVVSALLETDSIGPEPFSGAGSPNDTARENERENEREKPAGIVLVAEVQAGGLALLDLLRGSRLLQSANIALVPIFLDRKGDNIQAPIRALSQGAALYLLLNMPDQERRMEISLAVERARLQIVKESPAEQHDLAMRAGGHAARSGVRRASAHNGSPSRAPVSYDVVSRRFDWDEDRRILRAGESVIMLSAMESRLFSALQRNCGNAVPTSLLAQSMGPFKHDSALTDEGRIRPHVMRLRRKLAVCPWLARAIVSVRGVGYMLAAPAHEE